MVAGDADEIIPLGAQLYEYADTAAVIENLDLVVTVDTSVAHLAGALAKPVWLLLPFVADWRWMEGRDDSPWYPTVRIFRQTQPNDWSGVVQRVRAAIADLASGSRRSPTRGSAPEPIAVIVDTLGVAGPRTVTTTPGISRVCCTRAGMIQYLPANDRMAECLEYYGDYLPKQVDTAKSLVKLGDVVVVLSANIGWHTIGLATAVGPSGHVFAIERSSALRRILLQNLVTNEVQGVTVMSPSAASKSIDDLEFERVNLVLVNNRREVASVIEGAHKTLRRHSPALMFLEHTPEGLAAVDELMTSLGFQCWMVESPFFDPGNFNGRDVDIFSGECSYALVALPREREIPDHIRSFTAISRLLR
jgi:hypothetical protein